jgi:hypothetical protein
MPMQTTLKPIIVGPAQARERAQAKAVDSEEYEKLVNDFNKHAEDWDGIGEIVIKTSSNAVANRVFTTELNKKGWSSIVAMEEGVVPSVKTQVFRVSERMTSSGRD